MSIEHLTVDDEEPDLCFSRIVDVGYVPHCDFCFASLPMTSTFDGAVEAMKRNGWESARDEHDGLWLNACPACKNKYRLTPSAADDFGGIATHETS